MKLQQSHKFKLQHRKGKIVDMLIILREVNSNKKKWTRSTKWEKIWKNFVTWMGKFFVHPIFEILVQNNVINWWRFYFILFSVFPLWWSSYFTVEAGRSAMKMFSNYYFPFDMSVIYIPYEDMDIFFQL